MDKNKQQAGPGGVLPPQGDEELKKTGIFNKSMDFLHGAVDSLTGKDLPRLVEDFTREMVIVAEGLSEDQEKIRSALGLQGEEQDKAAERLRALEKQLAGMEKRLDELVRKAERRQKGDSSLMRILRQATWLAAILASAWVVTALIRAFGK